MKERLRSYRIWFESLAARQRFVLLGAAIIGIVLFGESFSWAEGRERLSSVSSQLDSLRAEHRGLENDLFDLDQSDALDPDAAARRQLELMDSEIAAVDESLRVNTLQILTPDQARLVFRDMIESIRGIDFVGLQTEPPISLVNSAQEDMPALYRHGLVIDLEGDYLSLLDYTRALEALPWSFYWLGLDVEAYEPGPRRFRVHLYTVSLREEWIGV